MHRRSSCPPSHFLGREAGSGSITKVVMSLAAHPFNMVVSHFVDRERLPLASVLDHDHVALRIVDTSTGHRATATTSPPANRSGGLSGGIGRCEILSAISAASSSYVADTHGTHAQPSASATIRTTRRGGERNTTCCNTVSFRGTIMIMASWSRHSSRS